MHYAYGPPLLEEGQAQISDIAAAHPAATDGGDQDRGPNPGLEALAVRQVTVAWGRMKRGCAHTPRRRTRPSSPVHPGRRSLHWEALGVRIPADLKALWSLHAGVDDVHSAGFLLDNRTLMDLDAVDGFYEMQMMFQRRDRGDEDATWRPSWIPFCSYWLDDRSSGLYLDSTTGELGFFSRYAERWTEYASLTTYLEEIADALVAPGLVPGAKPGLSDGALVCGPPVQPDPGRPWAEYTG